MAWGRKPACSCGECERCEHNAAARARYRAMSIDERRALRASRDAARVLADERKRTEQRGARMQADPEFARKRRAQWTVSNAVRDGKLQRQPCESCSAVPAQAHHDDYDRPLDVRWLCTACHAGEHALETQAA